MTSNQRRALKLADAIRRFGLGGDDLCESDWSLLLLAAGLNNCRAMPPNVAQRVLDQAGSSSGYFAPVPDEESSSSCGEAARDKRLLAGVCDGGSCVSSGW
jgi:hypothetical protein